jgi:adenine-specific DNA-methyltransferase
MAKKIKDTSAEVLSYRHSDRRKNNPEVGIVSPDTDPDQPKTTYSYDPHIDPTLQFDSKRFQIEKLIDDALASGDAQVMQQALEQLKRQQDPYLNWAGKAEKTSFDVDTVSLHVHERIDPASILSAVRKSLKKESKSKNQAPIGQLGLFNAPFENLPLRDAIDFYKHDRGWANRLVAGDSLLVMNSLLNKESMAGSVQMIFIDPPYGIKYGSNFQAFVNNKVVKDRKDEDLTQEPEMLKAFRDTWELGIHSYLTYLRDRLLLSKELLSETGSIFVQIGDENVELIGALLDEIFGKENFISLITFKKTNPLGSSGLGAVSDYLYWFAKNKKEYKFRKLLSDKNVGKDGVTGYSWVEDPSGEKRSITKAEGEDPELIKDSKVFAPTKLTAAGLTPSCVYKFKFQGIEFNPKSGSSWRTNAEGMERVIKSNRLVALGNSIYETKFFDDYPVTELTNLWSDTRGEMGGAYVVQTSRVVLERCMLMTTDPGDLVFDPTCGSGTTAVVAEKLGRRWITCDSSRVALTLTKHRLMTGSYDYYELKYPHEGLKGGFIYETVPHVTLKAIANNPEMDEIYERFQPELKASLAALNEELQRSEKKYLVSVGIRKDTFVDCAKDVALEEWEVPYSMPMDWQEKDLSLAFNKFSSVRSAMYGSMNNSINAHADQELMYERPAIDKSKLRITGPFTVEAVPSPMVQALDESDQPIEADQSISRSGESQRQHDWRNELIKTGIRGKNGQMLKLTDLESLPDVKYIHASGTIAETGERVVVSFGPEYSLLEQRQVEMAMREAGELFPRPKMILFCGFDFDPEASKDIDSTKGIIALRVKMNADLLTEDLKKQRSSNQSFWLMGQPDVQLNKLKNGMWQVEVNGFDYFDTVKGELISGGKGNIAAWMLDTDYDNRSLFPRQVFFPMAGSKDGWGKLKKEIKAELDEISLSKFGGTTSLPFEAGDNKRIAVKIVDDRGIESLKVIDLED